MQTEDGFSYQTIDKSDDRYFDPSHVALLTCPICGESTGVVMSTKIEDGKLTQPFKRRSYVDPSLVCPACREKYLSHGIMLINPKSCNLIVISEEFFNRIFTVLIPENHIAFADDDLIAKLQALPVRDEEVF